MFLILAKFKCFKFFYNNLPRHCWFDYYDVGKTSKHEYTKRNIFTYARNRFFESKPFNRYILINNFCTNDIDVIRQSFACLELLNKRISDSITNSNEFLIA